MSCPFGAGNGSTQTTAPGEPDPSLYYGNYLKLDKILSAQELQSEKFGAPAHDEMLFIIIHQTYELWFKQILWEVESVLKVMAQPYIPENDLGVVINRLVRVTEIQKILIDQIRALETMQPLDFLDFRKFLGSASGFQSLQFRLLENKLGIRKQEREKTQLTEYMAYFEEEDQKTLRDSHHSPTLFDLVEKWLERTPYLKFGEFDFWREYQVAVRKMMQTELDIVRGNPHLSPAERNRAIANVKENELSFNTIWEKEKHDELVGKGFRRLSHKAMQAALMILLYRDQSMMFVPCRLLLLLMDIDENMSLWRYRHTAMVHRMIGDKIGSGGSSGYGYLKSTIEDTHKVFVDLFNLSTFLIPSSSTPTLPPDLIESMNFMTHNPPQGKPQADASRAKD